MSNVNLYNNNCMDIFPTMEDDSVTLTLTDIPYDEVNRKSGGLRNLDKSHADIITFSLNDFIIGLSQSFETSTSASIAATFSFLALYIPILRQ